MKMKWMVTLILAMGLVFAVSCGDDDDDDDSSPAADDTADDSADDTVSDDADDTSDDDGYPEPYDPQQLGPYAVGNRSMVLIDETRDDYASRGKRTLLTEVWYPAEEWTRDLPRDHIYDFMGRWYGLIRSILRWLLPAEELANFEAETGSARDAKIFSKAGPFPMIIMSHGNAGIRFQGFTMAEYLASHGYIVVAPDHTGNAVFVTFPDRLSIFNPILMPWAFFDRIQDFSFLIDKFTELNAEDPEGFFTGMLDMDRVGEVGHSFGAVTSSFSGQLDRRVKAVIEMAGFELPVFPPGFNTPYFYMVGLEDHTMGDYEPLVRLDFLLAHTDKFLLEFINGGHYTFTDACVLMPSLMGDGDGCGSNERIDTGETFDFIGHDEGFHLLNSYVTAFFGYVLKGQDTMLDTLTQNIDPEELNYSYNLDGEVNEFRR